jgi:hypothetical protein
MMALRGRSPQTVSRVGGILNVPFRPHNVSQEVSGLAASRLTL